MHCTQCHLLGLVSLDFIRSGPSNMHRCQAFPFALAKLSCSNNIVAQHDFGFCLFTLFFLSFCKLSLFIKEESLGIAV